MNNEEKLNYWNQELVKEEKANGLSGRWHSILRKVFELELALLELADQEGL